MSRWLSVVNRGRGDRLKPSKVGGPPYSAPTLAQLRLLLGGVFDQAVRRVGYYAVQALVGLRYQPSHAVSVVETGLPVLEGEFHTHRFVQNDMCVTYHRAVTTYG